MLTFTIDKVIIFCVPPLDIFIAIWLTFRTGRAVYIILIMM